MGGHLDDAEHTMDKPIVSISIGCSAIFLVGGRERSVKPTPILVRSGDAIIMAGDSRYAYHGVPCVLPVDFQPLGFGGAEVGRRGVNNSAQLRELEGTDADLHVIQYLQQARININVRQVVACSDDEWIDKSGSGYREEQTDQALEK
mmetsp:Transcript_18996/g.42287  ORF Transcript_18996/g.42287 Transcript_18996/m.42287 type:complete len:147 (-) Transcript_18996:1000-1440(-)